MATNVHSSTRDHAELRARILTWLAARVDDPVIDELEVSTTNGVSSETVMFGASWQEAGTRRSEGCVLRMPPAADAVPVFPTYDMERQFRAMQLVAQNSTVP